MHEEYIFWCQSSTSIYSLFRTHFKCFEFRQWISFISFFHLFHCMIQWIIKFNKIHCISELKELSPFFAFPPMIWCYKWLRFNFSEANVLKWNTQLHILLCTINYVVAFNVAVAAHCVELFFALYFHEQELKLTGNYLFATFVFRWFINSLNVMERNSNHRIHLILLK